MVKTRNRAPSVTLLAIAGLVGAAMANKSGCQGINVNTNIAAGENALLLQTGPRATVPAMLETEQTSYAPGDLVPVAGVYKPQGMLANPDRERRIQPVTRGHQIVHESCFEVGDELPPLRGYRPGAVWVLRP